MYTENICQSCGMPLTDESMLGTESDGSKNHEYCKYCYQSGAFTNPGITLDEMQNLVKEKMEEMYIDTSVNEKIVDGLAYLKRWKQTAITSTRHN
ncbi:zinc ribbon domain-containing protein [Parafilimonas sp.]|uniref:zinc ribbon domain-containing protein n=1 Tax=Parafilimonas sp. TaxID=1969739 RepID=UPI003F7D5211